MDCKSIITLRAWSIGNTLFGKDITKSLPQSFDPSAVYTHIRRASFQWLLPALHPAAQSSNNPDSSVSVDIWVFWPYRAPFPDICQKYNITFAGICQICILSCFLGHVCADGPNDCGRLFVMSLPNNRFPTLQAHKVMIDLRYKLPI